MAAIRRLALGAFLLSFVGAADFSLLEPQGHLSDFASVVTPGARAELEEYAAAFREQNGVHLAVVILPTVHGEPVGDVAALLARKWGIGEQGRSGALLLIAIANRRACLRASTDLSSRLPGGLEGEILRRMRPAVREGNWSDAALLAVHELGERVRLVKALPGAPPAPRAVARRRPESGAVLAAITGVALVLFLLLIRFGSRLGSRSARCDRAAGMRARLNPLVCASDGGFGSHSGSGAFGGLPAATRAAAPPPVTGKEPVWMNSYPNLLNAFKKSMATAWFP